MIGKYIVYCLLHQVIGFGIWQSVCRRNELRENPVSHINMYYYFLFLLAIPSFSSSMLSCRIFLLISFLLLYLECILRKLWHSIVFRRNWYVVESFRVFRGKRDRRNGIVRRTKKEKVVYRYKDGLENGTPHTL